MELSTVELGDGIWKYFGVSDLESGAFFEFIVSLPA
jgi:hypothetical protein